MPGYSPLPRTENKEHTRKTNTHLLSFLGNTRGKAQLCSGRQGDGPASLFPAPYCQVSSRGFARVLDKSVKLALVIALADQRRHHAAHTHASVFALCPSRTRLPASLALPLPVWPWPTTSFPPDSWAVPFAASSEARRPSAPRGLVCSTRCFRARLHVRPPPAARRWIVARYRTRSRRPRARRRPMPRGDACHQARARATRLSEPEGGRKPARRRGGICSSRGGHTVHRMPVTSSWRRRG